MEEMELQNATVDDTQDRVQMADRKSTRLNSSHSQISYAVFCLKKKKTHTSSYSEDRQSPPPAVLDDQLEAVLRAIFITYCLTVPYNLAVQHASHYCLYLAPCTL